MRACLLEFEGEEASDVSAELTRAGFAVSHASGVGGLHVGDEALPEIVVLADTRHGAERCREIRNAGFTGVVIGVGPRLPTGTGIAMLEAGADDFLGRPFEPLELVARIRAVLRRQGSPPAVQWGALTLDRLKHVVRGRNRPLPLTEREYLLLASLIEAQGEVVTRAELLKRIGSTSAESRSNLVEVHLSRVRQKLGIDSRMIETVWRRGYRLKR